MRKAVRESIRCSVFGRVSIERDRVSPQIELLPVAA